MTLVISLTIAILFGAGAYLMLTRDLYRIIAGVVLASNAANLFVMASALTIGQAPIHPLPENLERVSDPLVQALTLTAVVIMFAVTALLAALVLKLYITHDTIDLEDVAEAEVDEEEQRKREA